MQVAARRPHFAAGVALVGASVIAASAVTPMPEIHLPDIQLPSVHMADLHLAALANPLETYAQVFQTALANVNTLVQNTVPGQLLNQLLANQVDSAATLLNGLSTTGGGIANAAAQVPAALATAVNQLAAGNVSGAVNTLLTVPLAVISPALDLLPVLQTVLTKPLENLTNVIHAFTADPLATLLAVSGFIAPLISAPAAAAAAVQNVINAVGTGDLGAVANAIISAPATIADGVLNGGYGPDLGPLAGIPAGSGISVIAGGLLSSSTSGFDPVTGNFVIGTGGPLYALQQVLKIITNAIAPKPPAAAPVAATAAIAAIPAADAATVTLTPATAPAKTTTTDAATTTDPTATKTATDKPSTEKPAGTDAAKDSSDAAASTPATTKDSTTTDSSTKDSTTKDQSSTGKTSTGSDVDVKTGNKVEPNTTAGSDAPKSGGSTDSAAGKDSASAEQSANSTTSATGGSDKSAGTASKGSSS